MLHYNEANTKCFTVISPFNLEFMWSWSKYSLCFVLSGSLEERLAVQNADKAAKVGRDVFFTKKEVDIYALITQGHIP